MASQNIQSLALFRVAGRDAGFPPDRFGQLSLVSYMIGNPMMALVLARSGPAATIPSVPGKDVVAAAAKAVKSAEAAAGSSKNAELAAKGAAGAEARAREAAELAVKAAEEAKAAARSGNGGTKAS